MPDSSVLSIQPRIDLRKHNKQLRASGSIPAVIYGHRVDAVPVSVPRREFERTFHRSGRTQLMDLQVEGEPKPRKVLVREVQYSPRTTQAIHIDFYQVNLKEKITADVPIVVVGESPAVHRRDGELAQNLHSLKLNCLPADIPEHIEVDVSGLENVDDAIRISELVIPDECEVLTDPDEVVIKVAAPRVAEVEEPTAEAAEGAEDATEAAGESGGGDSEAG